MVYRDDEFGKLRSKVHSLEERLEVFERLYKERGFTPKLGRKIVTGVFTFFRRITGRIKDFFTHPAVVMLSVGLGLLGLLFLLVNVTEANAAEKEKAEEQAIFDKCDSFCETHEYSFQDKYEGDLCFCTQEGSETPAFIINMETSEHWSVVE